MKIIHEMSGSEMVFYKTSWKAGVTSFHWHERVELVIPEDKPIAALIDGVWYEAAPQDILVIGEGKIHAFRVEHEESGILLGQFPYRILLNGSGTPYPLPPLIRAEELAKIPTLTERIHALLPLMLAEGRVERNEKNPVLQAMCTALYYLLVRHFAVPEEAHAEKKGKKEFCTIVSYVNAHFTENITVGSLARSLYIDRGKLSRLFLTYAGMSLNTYINTLRIGRARELIRGGAAVTEAALEAGFQSVRTFHEVCRRIMQTSPKALKK